LPLQERYVLAPLFALLFVFSSHQRSLRTSFSYTFSYICCIHHIFFLIFLLQYIAMYSDIGQKSNTMIFSDKPADVNALMAQASAVVKSLNNTAPAASSASGIPAAPTA
jgi:hypothetical protein